MIHNLSHITENDTSCIQVKLSTPPNNADSVMLRCRFINANGSEQSSACSYDVNTQTYVCRRDNKSCGYQLDGKEDGISVMKDSEGDGCEYPCNDSTHDKVLGARMCRVSVYAADGQTYSISSCCVRRCTVKSTGESSCDFQPHNRNGNESIDVNNGSQVMLDVDTMDKCPASKRNPDASFVSGSSVIRQLSFLDRYLSLWILITMVCGVCLGYFDPVGTANAFDKIDIATVSLPVAVGLWGMIFPPLVKVDYAKLSILLQSRHGWRQIIFSMVLNWLVAPLLMLGLAWMTLPDLPGYRAGVVMVGLARCIAMVLVWNRLASGDSQLCAVLVAMNSILQIALYAPLAILFLQVISRQFLGGASGTFHLSFWIVFRSVLLFLGVPLGAAIIARYTALWIRDGKYYDRFVALISPISLLALLWTIFVLFAEQGHRIITDIVDVVRVAVPMVIYFSIMFTATFFLSFKRFHDYETAVTQAFTAASNNFELAIAVAAATFGIHSEEALAATIGPLIEVPVMVALVYISLFFGRKYAAKHSKPHVDSFAVDDGAHLSPSAMHVHIESNED